MSLSGVKCLSNHAWLFSPESRGLVLLALALTITPFTITSSFDCKKASNATEKLICSDAKTVALDDQLAQAYKAALAATDSPGKKALRAEQRHWISYTRDICVDADCLQRAYTARIGMLARNEKNIIDQSSCQVLDGGTECVNVVIYRDPSLRMDSFNQSLAQANQAGKIIGCSKLINLPVGTAGSNNSFGGVCTLQDGTQRKSVEICDDDMFGHFEAKSVSGDISDKDLINFTHAYCFGG